MGTVRWPRARRVLPGAPAEGYAASSSIARPDPRAWLIDEPDFWRLWLVGLVVFAVRWLEMLAVAVFAYQHTGSPFIVAALTMLRMLPMALFGAVIGAAGGALRTAQRIDPRRPVDGADLADPGDPRLDRRARGLAPRGRKLIQRHCLDHRQPGAPHDDRRGCRARADERAMSIDVGANNASQIFGPTVGGILLATFGIGGAFTVSVLCYLVALAAALRVRHRNTAGPSGAQSMLARMIEGLVAGSARPRA